MNQHVIQPTAEPAQNLGDMLRTQEARNMRSLALQLRRNGHQYRRWARQEAAKGHDAAAMTFYQRAARYAADALWYWRRARREAVQFGEAS